jgi:hypothetical protein
VTVRARRGEIAAIGLTAIGAGVVAFLLTPLPPLLAALDDEGWTRGIEFVLLNLAAWMILGVLGILPMNIGIGLDGITAERREAEDQREEAAADIDAIMVSLVAKLERMVEVSEELAERQSVLDTRVDRLEQQQLAPPTAEQPGQATETDDA